MVPLSTYDDYAPYVDRMIHNKENNLMFTGWNVRYCSSSGSVGKPKILPKSVKDLWNMQCIGFSGTVATSAHYLKKYKNKNIKLFGPYPNSGYAKKIVEVLNRIYPLQKCPDPYRLK